MLDGAYGTLDPAFEAHAAPIRCWATAWWERWAPYEELNLAFQMASLKLATCKSSVWAKVAGPVAALLASMRRLGWNLPSAREAVDDNGRAWSFVLDAPAAIIVAVRQSVRRWRLHRLAHSMPALVPQACDVGAPSCPEGTTVVDFAATIGQLMSRRSNCKDWPTKWRGDLASALSGGQWPQARRAAVPAWGIEDKNCQLCHQEVGTLEHRWRCSATRPDEGWPAEPAQAKLALGRLDSERRRLLQTRALLAVRVPRPPADWQAEWFYFCWCLGDGLCRILLSGKRGYQGKR